MKKELSLKYVADAIIEVKKENFGEDFVSIDDLLIIKKLLEYKFENMGYEVEFWDSIVSSGFRVDRNIVSKTDLFVCEQEIEDKRIRSVIYDREFIYYCLCQMLINKLNNSMEHNCNNCNNECTGLFNQSHSKLNNCSRWTHDFVKDCINNISLKERTLLEGEQNLQSSVENPKESNWIQEIQEISSMLTREKSMELMDAREEFIKEKMKEIEKREDESEILGMLEDEDYDEEEFNMLLGASYLNNSLNNDNKGKKLVKKKDDRNESS